MTKALANSHQHRSDLASEDLSNGKSPNVGIPLAASSSKFVDGFHSVEKDPIVPTAD